MKTLLTLPALALGITLLSSASVSAAPITWTHEYDPTDVTINSTNTSLSYIHDLTSVGFLPGVSSTDQLTDGILELYLRDDELTDPAGQFKFTLELNLFTSGALDGENDQTFTFSLGLNATTLASVLASVQSDGKLNVLIEHFQGPQSDFIFERSVFKGIGTREEDPSLAAVPEPGSMLLLGTGLAGLVAYRMRRKRA